MTSCKNYLALPASAKKMFGGIYIVIVFNFDAMRLCIHITLCVSSCMCGKIVINVPICLTVCLHPVLYML
jgi:hypothetical protein